MGGLVMGFALQNTAAVVLCLLVVAAATRSTYVDVDELLANEPDDVCDAIVAARQLQTLQRDIAELTQLHLVTLDRLGEKVADDAAYPAPPTADYIIKPANDHDDRVVMAMLKELQQQVTKLTELQQTTLAKLGVTLAALTSTSAERASTRLTTEHTKTTKTTKPQRTTQTTLTASPTTITTTTTTTVAAAAAVPFTTNAVCSPVLIQQKVDWSAFFDRTWAEFRTGFGNATANYWLGNERLHQLTRDGRYKLRFDLQRGVTRQWYWAEYDSILVEDESAGYRLQVGRFSGNVYSDALNNGGQNGAKFTTFDRDNDLWAGNCATYLSAGFWYSARCGLCRVNGKGGAGGSFYWLDLVESDHWQLMTSRMWLMCL